MCSCASERLPIPLPLTGSFYANRVVGAADARAVYEALHRVRLERRLESTPLRAGVGIMTTPHTLSSKPSRFRRWLRRLFPWAARDSWPEGYPDRDQIRCIFRAFSERNEREPLLVHVVMGTEPHAYWRVEGRPYWKSRGCPIWRSVDLLLELGLRSFDVVRINLADHEHWVADLSEARRRHPAQRFSLQIHGRDLDMHRDDLCRLAEKVIQVAPFVDEFQIDQSLSAGELGEVELQINLYHAIRARFENEGLGLKPVVFSGGVGPETVQPLMRRVLAHCRFAGTDAVSRLQSPRLLGWGGGISARKAAATFEQYLEVAAEHWGAR